MTVKLSTSRNWSSGSFGAKSPVNDASFNNRSQQGSVRRCFECNSPDHIRASCPRIGSNNNASQSSQHNNQVSTQQQKPAHTQASKPMRRTECEHVNIEQFDTRDTIDIVNTAHSVKMVNHALTNNLCDSGNRSEVVQAVVDSVADMCVARQDIIDSLDCLTVGQCKLRGIVADSFDVEVKRLFVGTASSEKLVPVALACHELVHDPLLLTPAVVKSLITDEQCDHTDQSDCLEDSTGHNDVDGHDDNANHVDESSFESCTELSVSMVDCSGLTTTIEPDCLKFIDILSTPKETRAKSKALSVEQTQADSLSHW